MDRLTRKHKLRLRRKRRIRAKLSGTSDRPRLSVYRSAKHFHAQVIDDTSGKTLCHVSSMKKLEGDNTRAKAELCGELGKQLASDCLAKSIKQVVFDKNGFVYHGRVKSFADGAREAGLKF